MKTPIDTPDDESVEFKPEPYSGTPGKPKTLLVDIDGTLADNVGGRGWYDWSRVGEDTIVQPVADVVNSLGFGNSAMDIGHYNIVVMSGRDEVCRPETEAWLKEHIVYDALYMRPEGDMRKDNIIKAELFDRYIRGNYDVQFVIDDRWSVCEMWLQMGLKVFNVSGLDRGEF